MKAALLVGSLLILTPPARAEKALDQLGAQGGAGAPAAAPSMTGTAALVKRAPARVEDCDEADRARLTQAVDEAREAVEGCLSGLDPGIAARIQRGQAKYRFRCGEDTGLEGGRTVFGERGAVDIFLNLHSRMAQAPLAQRVFHEMIHACDPAGKLIVSPQVHAKADYPDPVYGCQLACFRAVYSDQADTLDNFQRQMGLELEQDQAFACKPGEDCPHLRMYAKICREGKPPTNDKVRQAAVSSEAPKCVVEGALNDPACEKTPACAKLQEAAHATLERGGSMRPFLDLGRKLLAAAPEGAGLDEDDAALYRFAKKKGYLRSCAKGVKTP